MILQSTVKHSQCWFWRAESWARGYTHHSSEEGPRSQLGKGSVGAFHKSAVIRDNARCRHSDDRSPVCLAYDGNRCCRSGP